MNASSGALVVNKLAVITATVRIAHLVSERYLQFQKDVRSISLLVYNALATTVL